MKINLSDEKFLNSETDLKHKDVVTIATEGKWQASDTFKDDDGNPSREFRIDFKLLCVVFLTSSLGSLKLIINSLVGLPSSSLKVSEACHLPSVAIVTTSLCLRSVSLLRNFSSDRFIFILLFFNFFW